MFFFIIGFIVVWLFLITSILSIAVERTFFKISREKVWTPADYRKLTMFILFVSWGCGLPLPLVDTFHYWLGWLAGIVSISLMLLFTSGSRKNRGKIKEFAQRMIIVIRLGGAIAPQPS